MRDGRVGSPTCRSTGAGDVDVYRLYRKSDCDTEYRKITDCGSLPCNAGLCKDEVSEEELASECDPVCKENEYCDRLGWNPFSPEWNEWVCKSTGTRESICYNDADCEEGFNCDEDTGKCLAGIGETIGGAFWYIIGGGIIILFFMWLFGRKPKGVAISIGKMFRRKK